MTVFWPRWYLLYAYGTIATLLAMNIVLSVTTLIAARKLLKTQTGYQRRVHYTFIYITITYVTLWTIPKACFFIFTKTASVRVDPFFSTLQWHTNEVADNIMALTNFVVYGWRHPEVRSAIVVMFRGKKDARTIQVMPSSSSRLGCAISFRDHLPLETQRTDAIKFLEQLDARISQEASRSVLCGALMVLGAVGKFMADQVFVLLRMVANSIHLRILRTKEAIFRGLRLGMVISTIVRFVPSALPLWLFLDMKEEHLQRIGCMKCFSCAP
uniref:G protein-coupled receptor n=1 Tax=Steinernema glaseri TaxID=37863 RepID=A0A1I7YNE3_9BILA